MDNIPGQESSRNQIAPEDSLHYHQTQAIEEEHKTRVDITNSQTKLIVPHKKVVPDFWCKVCQKNGTKKSAEFINLNDFVNARYLCKSHTEGKSEVISIIKRLQNNARLWSDFNKNLTINKKADESFKKAIQRFYEQNVESALEQYEKQVLKNLEETKNFIKCQYKAVIDTFDGERVRKFIEQVEDWEISESTSRNFNIEVRSAKQAQLMCAAQGIRLSGNTRFSNLEELIPMLKTSYSETGDLLKIQTLNIQSHKKVLLANLTKKSLEKVARKIRKVDKKSEGREKQYEEGQDEGNQNKNQGQKIQVVQLGITSTNFKKIFSHLQSPQRVTKIKCKYQTQAIIPLTIKNFGYCKNLQQLYIEQPLLGTKQVIQFVVNTFSRLKRVAWNCYNEFNDYCASLVVKNLKDVEKCYWGCNYYRSIARMCELRAFREHKKKKRRQSISNKALLEMAKNLKSLDNIWISDLNFEDIDELFKELKNLPKLKHLTIGKQHTEGEISEEQWSYLSHNITGLYSLAFLNIQINEQYLIHMLEANKQTLRTVVFYSCPIGLTDEVFRVMKTYPLLKELYVFSIGDNLQQKQCLGKYIWELTQLETLSVRKCDFQYEYFCEKIGEMKELNVLDLEGNYWVNDMAMIAIAKLYKSLEFLNVGRTNITTGSNSPISSLKRLKNLSLANTKLNHKSVEQIISSIPNLTKINIESIFMGKSIINRGKMHWLGRTITNCTYLDCSQCDRFDDRCFETFSKLQFVNLWNTMGISEETKDHLRRRGIVVLDNSISEVKSSFL